MACTFTASLKTVFNRKQTEHSHLILGRRKCPISPRRRAKCGPRACSPSNNPHWIRHQSGFTSILPSRHASRRFSTATYSLRDDLPETPAHQNSEINFGSYNVGLPPTKAQLHKADRYFTNSKANPHMMMLTPKFRNLPVSDVPEVVFLGRSNVGKSSLLNALLEKNIKELAKTSKHPGHTKTLNAYGINGVTEYLYTPEDQISGGMPGPKFKKWTGPGGLVVIDTPGYGSASRVEWGSEIMKYLTSRKQLRRAFLLVDSEHGLKINDMQMLRILHDNGVPHQIIFVKADKIFKIMDPENTMETLKVKCKRIRQSALEEQDPGGKGKRARLYSDIIFTSTQVHWPPTSNPTNRRKMGVANLRYEVLNACGYFNVGLDAAELVQDSSESGTGVQQSRNINEVEEDNRGEEDIYDDEESLENVEEEADVGREQKSQGGGRIRRGLRRRPVLRSSVRS